jgi:hypothetical protein
LHVYASTNLAQTLLKHDLADALRALPTQWEWWTQGSLKAGQPPLNDVLDFHVTPLLTQVFRNESSVTVFRSFFATKEAPAVDQVFL